MTQETQDIQEMPEALRLADALSAECESVAKVVKYSTAKKAAAELRRQHAEIERLKAQEGDLCMLYALEQAECRKLRTELAVLRRSLTQKK